MRLLVNTSNLVIGGGIQVGSWFIQTCLQHQLDAYFVLSPAIHRELTQLGIHIDANRFSVVENSPARNKKSRQEVRQYADMVSANVVFTVFGPGYVKFSQPHLCGFADGWVSHSSPQVFSTVFKKNKLAGIKLLATSVYKAMWLKYADEWVFETKTAANGLAKRIALPTNKCHVVNNNCAERFYTKEWVPEPENKPFVLLYFTADYPHKGIINYLDYARELYRQSPEKAVVFRITISPESESAQAILRQIQYTPLEQYFDFCGYVPIQHAVDTIDSANVVMQTSYLETFSANYPEAMARRRALIVSDFDFARSICGDAAYYVDPDNAESVAKAIISLSNNQKLRDELIEKGSTVLSTLPKLEERFERYIEILKRLSIKELS